MKRKPLRVLALTLALLLLLTGTSFAAGETQVKNVSCSVYGDGATGRGFCWFTEGKAGTDLQLIRTDGFSGDWSEAKTYEGSQTLYRSRRSHQVAVTDLAPGTAYTYRVGDAKANVWSEAFSFVTDDKDESFSFLAIADVQAGNREDFLHSAKTLEGAVRTLPEAEFIVNLGDYVNDNTNEEWDLYFEAFAPYNGAFTGVPVAGNHDGNVTNKLNTFCFQNTFCLDETDNRSLEGVYYSFDYGNAHFAVLNTNDMYPMSQAQKNWLRNDMNGSDATWKILLMHRSLYSAGKNINKPDTVVMREVLLPIIDELGLDVVLSGHDHMYLRTDFVKNDARVGNVSYVTETFRGEETRFAVDPDGTVYAIPSTAGTKRYAVNGNAIAPILDVAEKAFSTRDRGGMFAAVEIEGGRLVYKAYLVDDETGEVTAEDVFAVKKTAAGAADPSRRDQSFFSTVYAGPVNFLVAFFKMMVDYVKLLTQVIGR